MRALRVLVVDDEQPARKKLSGFLKTEERVESILEAGDGAEAVETIRRFRPDLVFLDIQMPEMGGFEVIEGVGPDRMPPVIFVTAFDRYAIAAFEVQAVDYLLKPYDRERFAKSFDRAYGRILGGSGNAELFETILREVKRDNRYDDRILVRKGDRYFFVRTGEITHVSAEEKYVKLHTKDGVHLIRETMTRMENRLDPGKFVRIHRSSLVNLDHIQEIQPWSHGDSLVILKTGEKLILSRRHRDKLF